MLRTQLFIAAALLSGVAIGYFAKPDPGEAGHEERQEAAVRALFSDKGDEASLAALRARIADLERRLAARGETNAAARTESKVEPGVTRPDEAARPERRGPPTAAEMRERMARFEKEDPQRFAQMTNHFAQMRMRRQERAAMKIDFLSSIDTSGMDESARQTHEALQGLIARREELEEKIHNLDLSDEERAGAFEELRRNGDAMRELNRAERDNLLAQTSAALGLSGEDAEELTETIKDIIEATEGSFGRGRGGPPPGMPGPRP